jgi:SlyX protein
MTTDTDPITARLDKLETLLAQQDEVISDLNDIVTRQWAEIDRLKRLTAALVDRVGEAEAKARNAEPQQPPPHY